MALVPTVDWRVIDEGRAGMFLICCSEATGLPAVAFGGRTRPLTAFDPFRRLRGKSSQALVLPAKSKLAARTRPLFPVREQPSADHRMHLMASDAQSVGLADRTQATPSRQSGFGSLRHGGRGFIIAMVRQALSVGHSGRNPKHCHATYSTSPSAPTSVPEVKTTSANGERRRLWIPFPVSLRSQGRRGFRRSMHLGTTASMPTRDRFDNGIAVGKTGGFPALLIEEAMEVPHQHDMSFGRRLCRSTCRPDLPSDSLNRPDIVICDASIGRLHRMNGFRTGDQIMADGNCGAH